jgi:hypothetical protein
MTQELNLTKLFKLKNQLVGHCISGHRNLQRRGKQAYMTLSGVSVRNTFMLKSVLFNKKEKET